MEELASLAKIDQLHVADDALSFPHRRIVEVSAENVPKPDELLRQWHMQVYGGDPTLELRLSKAGRK